MINIDDILKKEPNDAIIDLSKIISKKCNYGDELEKLSEVEKVFFFNQTFEMEVNNGGIDQFFINSSGRYVLETIKSLKMIGAEKTSDILKKAVKRKKNILFLFRENKFEALDECFYRYEDDLNSLNLKFIKKNKTEFNLH